MVPAQCNHLALSWAPIAALFKRGDPRLELDAQKFIDAATALRSEARRSAAESSESQYGSPQEVFRQAVSDTETWAEKIPCSAEPLARYRIP